MNCPFSIGTNHCRRSIEHAGRHLLRLPLASPILIDLATGDVYDVEIEMPDGEVIGAEYAATVATIRMLKGTDEWDDYADTFLNQPTLTG